LKGICWQH